MTKREPNCKLCRNPLSNRPNLTTECGHKFHVHCLEKQIKRIEGAARVCPVCKHALPDNLEPDKPEEVKKAPDVVQPKAKKGVDCQLCQKPLLDVNIIISDCEHKFHKNCLQKCVERRSGPRHICPVCGGNMIPEGDWDVVSRFVAPESYYKLRIKTFVEIGDIKNIVEFCNVNTPQYMVYEGLRTAAWCGYLDIAEFLFSKIESRKLLTLIDFAHLAANLGYVDLVEMFATQNLDEIIKQSDCPEDRRDSVKFSLLERLQKIRQIAHSKKLQEKV